MEIEMDKVFVTEVIISTQNRKGTGQDKLSPIRVLTEVFTKEGKKIAEHDPCQNDTTFCATDLVHFAKWWIGKGYVNTSQMNIHDVHTWLESVERGEGI
jgi:hypothetical protein